MRQLISDASGAGKSPRRLLATAALALILTLQSFGSAGQLQVLGSSGQPAGSYPSQFGPFSTRQQSHPTNILVPNKKLHQAEPAAGANSSAHPAPAAQQVAAPSASQHQQAAHLSPPINPYTKATYELLLDLRQQILNRAMKFDEHFRNLLTASKLSLHNMFFDTYGILYEKNMEIFTGMFEGLEQSYANGPVKINRLMEDFFEKLYQKIFQVYNNNRSFPPSYLECATEQLAHLKPFKDVPEKLTNEIRHTFVAARTFNQALNHGIDVIKNIISLGQPASCTNLINEKLLKNSPTTAYGQLLQGPAARAPCLNFCEQVIVRCVGRANLEPLNERWRAYVVALNDLAMKLSTSYNIETIIAPLDVQISEAIMNFQENAQNISHSVFQMCGRAGGADLHSGGLKPAANRIRRRSAAPSASIQSYRQHQLSQPLASFTLAGHVRAAAKEGLARGAGSSANDLTPIGQKSPQLIEEIKNYMLSTKGFWSALPSAVCTSNYTLGSNATKRQTSGNCFQEPLGLSDMNSDLRYRSEIQQQVSRLDLMRSRIESALAGVETDWSGGPAEQRPAPVAPASSGRLAPTSSTTTTTSAPGPDDDTDYDNIPEEDGSTDHDSVDYPTDEEELISTTDVDDADDSAPTSDDSATSSFPADSSTEPDPSQADNNRIDGPLQTIPEDTQSNLITALNQAGAQKSSQTSTKLVISNRDHLLFSSLTSVAVLIVIQSLIGGNHRILRAPIR